MTYVVKTLRIIFHWLDSIIFSAIPEVYDLLMKIARTSILTQGDIASMADRIYKLLAVFMIFKVTFSLIMYVVNPDDFIDKSKGVGKLVTNIIISLALLILTPYIFRYAYELQTAILEKNTIATVVFGEKTEDNFLNTAGEDMAFITLSPFFTPNLGLTDIVSDCSNLMVKDSSGSVRINESCTGISSNDYQDLNDDSSMFYVMGKTDTAKNELSAYVAGVNSRSLALMFRQDMVVAKTTQTANKSQNDEWVMDYRAGISTIVGAFIVILLVTFCMDIALRSIKLAFLQLIAPIPIISYVDPKSGKDGLFKKWYQMCFKTFLSLFVRLLAIYFAVYIISKVADGKLVDLIDGHYVTNLFISVFIIIGALMFAKQLPKILEGLGIKLDGDGKFFLNPFKKLEEQALGGKQLIGVGAAGAAGVAAFGTNLIARKGNIFSAVAGGFSATARGLKGAAKGEKFGKNFTNSYNGAMKARLSRADRKADGVGWFEMQDSKIKQKLGIHTKGEAVKSATDTAKQISSVYNSMMGYAEGNDKAEFTAEVNGQNRTFKGIKGINDFITETKKTPINRNDYATEEDYLNAVQSQQDLIASLEDIKKARLNQISEGSVSTGDASTDSAIKSGYKQMQKLAKDLADATQTFDPSISKIPSDKDAKTINGMAKGIANHITSSEGASHQTTVDQYATKKDQK